MIDLYLKFANEEQATEVLYTDTKPKYRNIDTLGVIYQRPPENAADDYVSIAEDGWHVNVRVVDEDPSPLEQYVVVPNRPRRIWS